MMRDHEVTHMDTDNEKGTARILLCQQELRPVLQVRGLLRNPTHYFFFKTRHPAETLQPQPYILNHTP
jgi:hypothetical protein